MSEQSVLQASRVPSLPPSRDRLFNLIVLAVYVAITLTVALHHEPWRDEADSWLLVRDAGIVDVVERMSYTGTPALWYLVIFPLARIGLPFAAQTLVNLLITAIAAAVWLWSAPFSRALRIAALFCYPLGYEYAVIARSYGLSVLLLFLFLANYCENKRPAALAGLLLALLANTNVPSAILATLLMGVLFFERRSRYEGGRGVRIAGAIFTAGLLVAILQVNPAPDANVAATIASAPHPSFWIVVGGAFWPWGERMAAALVGVFVLVNVVFALRKRAIAVAYLLISVSSLSLLFSIVWANGPRHYGFVFLTTLAALWIGAPAPDKASRSWRLSEIAVSILFIFSIASTVRWWTLDYRQPFSGGRAMGTFIRDHGLGRYPIAAHFPVYTESVLPYLRHQTRFWYPAIGEYGSYMKWDNEYERGLNVGYEEAVRRTRKEFGAKPYLLLLAAGIPDPAARGYRLLYGGQPASFAHPEERYWLYAAFGKHAGGRSWPPTTVSTNRRR